MFIARRSPLGKLRTKDIPVTPEQLQEYYDGAPVEKTFLRLSLEHREFIMTGSTREDWLEIYGKEDNDYGRSPKLCS